MRQRQRGVAMEMLWKCLDLGNQKKGLVHAMQSNGPQGKCIFSNLLASQIRHNLKVMHHTCLTRRTWTTRSEWCICPFAPSYCLACIYLIPACHDRGIWKFTCCPRHFVFLEQFATDHNWLALLRWHQTERHIRIWISLDTKSFSMHVIMEDSSSLASKLRDLWDA